MRLPLAAVGSVCRTSCPLSAVRTAIVRLMMVALISNCSMKLLFSSLKIKSAVYIDRTFVTIVFLPSTAGGSSLYCRTFVNSLTHEGESACYLAARQGHLAVVRLLVKAHANINQLTNDSSCPLYAGRAYDQPDVHLFPVAFVGIVKLDFTGLSAVFIRCNLLSDSCRWRTQRGCRAAGQ